MKITENLWKGNFVNLVVVYIQTNCSSANPFIPTINSTRKIFPMVSIAEMNKKNQ